MRGVVAALRHHDIVRHSDVQLDAIGRRANDAPRRVGAASKAPREPSIGRVVAFNGRLYPRCQAGVPRATRECRARGV